MNAKPSGETAALMQKQIMAFHKAIANGCTQSASDVLGEVIAFRDLALNLEGQRDRLRAALRGMLNTYAPHAENTVAREGIFALQSDVRRALQALGCIMSDDEANAALSKAKGE
jgi:hypothetical protein